MTDDQFGQMHAAVVQIAAELAGIRVVMTTALTPKRATVERDGCAGIEQCAKRDPEARVALMGGMVMCAGCQQRLPSE